MEIAIEIIYGIIGLIIGLILAPRGSSYQGISACSSGPGGTIVVVDDNRNVYLSGDQGNSWIKRGKLP